MARRHAPSMTRVLPIQRLSRLSHIVSSIRPVPEAGAHRSAQVAFLEAILRWTHSRLSGYDGVGDGQTNKAAHGRADRQSRIPRAAQEASVPVLSLLPSSSPAFPISRGVPDSAPDGPTRRTWRHRQDTQSPASSASSPAEWWCPGLSTEASAAHCPSREGFSERTAMSSPILKLLTVMAITPLQAKSKQQ